VRFVFPLDPGVSQGSTPGYYLSSLRDEDGETREFMCGGCEKMRIVDRVENIGYIP
jgi:hypothetical protein